MPTYLTVENKQYAMDNLSPADTAYLKKYFKDKWNSFIDKLKTGPEINNLNQAPEDQYIILARAKILLVRLGKKSEDAEKDAVRQATFAIRHGRQPMNFKLYDEWREFSESDLMFKSTHHGHYYGELKIHHDERLVFSGKFRTLHRDGHLFLQKPREIVDLNNPGEWQKILDQIWIDYCEKLRTDYHELLWTLGSDVARLFINEWTKQLEEDYPKLKESGFFRNKGGNE